MASLKTTTPCTGLLPVTVAEITLSEVDPGPMTLIMPFNDRKADVNTVLGDSLSLVLPDPNQYCDTGHARLIWFGRDSAMLTGCPAPDLNGVAGTTDQTDAWVCVELSGDGIEDVLARLVPADLRVAAFPAGGTLRTLVGHMTASLVRVSNDRILVMVFRSMAGTLVEELKEAMEAVAARG